MVHPQARDHLEEPEPLLAVAPAVDHHRHRADVHAVGGEEQQVAGDPVELGEEHADPLRPLGDVLVDAEELLGGEAEHQLVEQRRGVVHPRDVGGALEVGEVLARLLHAGVQVADDRLGAQHGLALELEHEAQHAVGAGVLRPHVDDHRLVLGRALADQLGHLGLGEAQRGAELAEQLLGARGAAGRHLLGALGGLDARAERVQAAVSVIGRPPFP